MALSEYDSIMSDYLIELRALIDAGLVDERTGPTFSSGERFITISKRLWEMARDRGQTRKLRHQKQANHDVTFARLSERHVEEAPARAERLQATEPRVP